MDPGYARVSTTKQDRYREIDAPRQGVMAAQRIYVDKISRDRPTARGSTPP